MKKILVSLAASAALVGAASAQSSIAAWDYSQYAFDNFASTDGTTLSGTLSANYTGSLPDYNGAPAFGTMYYDGTLGSTAFDLNAQEVTPIGILDTAVGNQGYLGVTGSLNTLNAQSQPFVAGRGFGLSTNGAFTFELTPGGSTDFTTLDYAAYNTNDAASTLTWEYSTNSGASWNALDVDAISTTQSAFSVDISAITGVSSALIRGTLGGLDSNLFAMDNVEFNGTVVPEPSSFAALAGVLALAFVATRRRK